MVNGGGGGDGGKNGGTASKRVRAPRNSGEHKDGKYMERRKRNNVAAKKSRDARKQREDEIAIRASYLEKENSILKAQLQTLKDEAQQLRILLAQKKSAAAAAATAAASSSSNNNNNNNNNSSCINCSNCSALAAAAAAAAVVANKNNGNNGMYGQQSCYEPLHDSHLDLKTNGANGVNGNGLMNGSNLYLPHQPRHQIM